jgi:hypothetical protein
LSRSPNICSIDLNLQRYKKVDRRFKQRRSHPQKTPYAILIPSKKAIAKLKQGRSH